MTFAALIFIAMNPGQCLTYFLFRMQMSWLGKIIASIPILSFETLEHLQNPEKALAEYYMGFVERI